MRQIKFSIIVPFYNVEKYIDRCLDSLFRQTYQDYEIIMINDGSEDNSENICRNYVEKDNRFILINKDNGGLSDARNFGIRNSTGEYLIFVDSDDYIDIDSCELFYNTISKNGSADIITSNIKSEEINNNVVYEKYSDIVENTYLSGNEFLKVQLSSNSMRMSACRNIYSRKFIIDNNFLFKFGIYHEDEQWTPRVFLSAKKILSMKNSHYTRVIREGSITRLRIKTKNALDLIDTCNELKTIYMKVEDPKLRKLLSDNLVTLYLNGFYIGRLLGKRYKSIVSLDFFVGLPVSRKNRFKIFVFKFSKIFYYYLNKTSKRLFKN